MDEPLKDSKILPLPSQGHRKRSVCVTKLSHMLAYEDAEVEDVEGCRILMQDIFPFL